MAFRSGAHERSLSGVDEKRPVDTDLALQQLAEQCQGSGNRPVLDHAGEVAVHHEVRAGTAAYLVRDHLVNRLRIGRVVNVEAGLGQGEHRGWQTV